MKKQYVFTEEEIFEIRDIAESMYNRLDYIQSEDRKLDVADFLLLKGKVHSILSKLEE